ncbi:uncharacterized protein LOC124875207 [Girardinichthys multiradiatus]|uniref:uncharacterized protein LOC124875207 n=1 Tax=Girardinichthys multiradiatus TaxID=208333 RepID=UPI001FAE3731|nr:uncharacterized protein LOC124875207 [Girardinichthys multiradiatus]XP_047233159.1 uncharacterized protein LOC124875207 [Girardinichthys multiradiatus]XP_047233160.1 uncharacterized protein LOC124875207 [Girardinichthys multiradiatus]
MTGGRELLLLAVMPLLVRCQKPSVSMYPRLESIFTGDLFYLYCKDVSNGSTATWYFNNEALENKNSILKIAPAASKNSGTYQCKIKDTRSDDFHVRVLEYVPIASLTIATGQPVMRKYSKVLLEIENETGLDGWFCKVTRGEQTWAVYLKQVDKSATSFVFETRPLNVPETIYWCVKKNDTYRSNQVILRTTEKEVTLEMDPFPAAAGETLTLTCLVWGTNDISNSVFYKNNRIYATVTGPIYKITKINESEGGDFKCEATYRYKAQTIEASHKYDSDVQEVLVHASPFRAVLSDSMQCSCPTCSGPMTYSYYKQNAKSWKMLGQDQRPGSSGTYHCRAVLGYMRTLPSNSVNYGTSIIGTVIGFLVAIVGIGICVFLVIFCWYKQRKTKGDIYEEVQMRQTGDPKYETLNVARVKEGEYDTLQPETEGRKGTGGTYEALTKQDNKEEVYHTLGETVASEGGDGGYEALKKEGILKDEYETLNTSSVEKKTGTGSEGGDGGYEALKKEGIQKDEYETLKTKQAEWRPGALSQVEIVEEINENK